MAENFVIRHGLKVLENVTFPITEVTDAFTANTDGIYTIVSNKASGENNVILPDPTLNRGRVIVVKNLNSTDKVVVGTIVGKEIDKRSTFDVLALNNMSFQSDGTRWLRAGETGTSGTSGSSGSSGTSGSSGSSGSSGTSGSSGSSGSSGTSGSSGSSGSSGTSGSSGSSGSSGTSGSSGSSGSSGTSGSSGSSGSSGTSGSSGSSGSSGTSGSSGSSGTSGVINVQNSGDNRVLTDIDGVDANAEANLTFDGSTLTVTGNAEITGTLSADTINGTGMATGVDNSVVIKDSDGILKTDEIDSRVWGSSLVDTDGSGTLYEVALWNDSNTVRGVEDFVFDLSGTYNVLKLNNPTYLKGNTASIKSASSSGTAITISENAGRGAIFEYVAFDSSGNQRTGMIMSSWDLSGNVVYNETSTSDLNGSTSNLKFGVVGDGTDIKLDYTILGGTWAIDVFMRVI